jgi:transposase-like protein
MGEQDRVMKDARSFHRGHRFPATVSSCAVRRYFRFPLSLRDFDQHGAELDPPLRKRGDKAAAKRFFKHTLA